jgi:hypothetical protein
MPRTLAALLAVALGLSLFAADPPKPAVAAAHVRIELTKVTTGKDASLVMTEVVSVPTTADVTSFKEIDGKQVPVTEKQTVVRMETVQVELPAKGYKATGTDGKEIPAADLEKRLKGGAVAVVSLGQVPLELRKVFKDDTVFIERLPVATAGSKRST